MHRRKEDADDGEDVLMSRQGEICTITINRPSVRNAWTANLRGIWRRPSAWREGERQRVVVLEGADGTSPPGRTSPSSRRSSPSGLAGRDEGLEGADLSHAADPAAGDRQGPGVSGHRRRHQPGPGGRFRRGRRDGPVCENSRTSGSSSTREGTISCHASGLVKARDLAMLGDVIDGKTAAAMA